jgi:hypothetical protein
MLESQRLSRLSFALACALAAAHMPSATASSTLAVARCADDGGSDTLRGVINAAAVGDIIDLRGLPAADVACTSSTITLTQGAIPVAKSLTILGAGRDTLSITSNGATNLFNASDAGSYLALQSITVSGAQNTTTTKGGCIYSKGEVRLDNAVVTGCGVSGLGSNSKYRPFFIGGGIFANTVRMTNGSSVSNNALTFQMYLANTVGGGLYAHALYCTDSTISGNEAVFGAGGGAAVDGVVTLSRCTVDSNLANKYGGGLSVATGPVTIDESTISGNLGGNGGGLFAKAPIAISNSTVAFNYAGANMGSGIYSSYDVAALSTIIARNRNQTGQNIDITVPVGKKITGSNNLIMFTSATAATGVIATTADPLLVPLGDHGGMTRTHALLAGSPAIDAGKNTKNFPQDQRGAGFAREVPTGKPDIGAYEKQAVDDEIFYDGFDDG